MGPLTSSQHRERVLRYIEVAREQGTNVRKKAAEVIDNSFAENLEKSGLLKEIWGGEVPR